MVRITKHPTLDLLLVLLVPTVLKLFLLSPDRLFEAHTIAVEWIGTGEFRYHHLGAWNYNYQFPIYPAIVTGLYLLGAGQTGVMVFQVICGTLTALLIHRFTLVLLHQHSYARTVALGAALLVGLDPFLAYYQVRVLHPLPWDTLMAVALLYLSCTVRLDRPWQLTGLFALAGAVLLNRPTLIVLLFPFFWIHCRTLIGAIPWPRALALIVLLVLPASAWLYRNHAVYGTANFNSATGQNLWIGIQEATGGTAQLPDGSTYLTLLTTTEREQLLTMDPLQQSAFFTAKWRAELAERPSLWWKMMGGKLWNFWAFRANAGVDHDVPYMRWVMLLHKVLSVVLSVLFLCAFWSHDPLLRSVLVALLLLSMAQAVFYVETRHRLLIEPVLLMVAMVVLAAFTQRVRKR